MSVNVEQTQQSTIDAEPITNPLLLKKEELIKEQTTINARLILIDTELKELEEKIKQIGISDMTVV